jgi:hypothetical protein
LKGDFTKPTTAVKYFTTYNKSWNKERIKGKKRSEPIITQETLATTTTTSGLFREMAFESKEQRQSCNGGTRDRYDPSETKRKKRVKRFPACHAKGRKQKP